MTLKWMAVMVAAVSVTLCVTANVVLGTVNGAELPVVVNMIALTATGVATVLAVVADLHERLNERVTALTEFLIARLNELDSHAGDRNTGFVEGYLLSHPDPSVVPIGPRMHSRRAMLGGDD
ncbi:hypothetical protein AB0J90_32380 [Micromonospora sp. NPDC049523]|uniref:hypothetical protein n=1 Tax=unclassified Micromonospora TaxID=2617518 RepID=UPI002DD8259E|nr:hypothetical protein [Micromonospora sp. NBC_01796]WSA89293.1 hypothetical protein OIE47_17750 [Micromonospora sp. NBC_01796]